MTERTEQRETICAVAQDIMPLLLDEVCSPESRGFVEEHVRTCESCRAVLTHMQAEERQTPSPEAKAKNRAQWQGLSRYCKRLTSRGFLLGLAATVLLAALAAFLLSIRLLERGRLAGGALQIGGLLGLWALAFLFVFFTFRPPHIALFQDPLTGLYGI